MRPAPSLLGAALVVFVAASGDTPPPFPDDCTIPQVRSRARYQPGGVTGRYHNGEDVVFLASCGPAAPRSAPDSVAVSPAQWTSIEYALRVGPDSFAVFDRPHRTIVVERNGAGGVEAIRTTGFGLPAHMNFESALAPLPIEHLVFGNDVDSAVQALADAAGGPAQADSLLGAVFGGFPSRRQFIAHVFARVSARWPTDVALARDAAETKAIIGDSIAALRVVEASQHLAPTDTGLQRVAAWLGGGRSLPDTGWRVPFSPETVLALPSGAEIAATWHVIAERQRTARRVTIVDRSSLTVHGAPFRVTIVSHDVDGSRHIGAIVVPEKPGRACCATIVDIKGTSPGYRPLNLDRGPPVLRMLGDAAQSYIYVVPAIRGEVLRLGSHEWRAEGDRTDGWDGGAEDALGLLAAAQTIEPRIDRTRSCVFGRSRGAAVALLVAERDERIRCVVAISPPVDWFDAMWAGSWPKVTVLRVALRTHATPFDQAGQFVEWIMAPVARGQWRLADARRRMIAMSPLYYAHRLPAALVISGSEDASVPVRNAIVLDSALRALWPGQTDRSVVVTPMAGHDTDPIIAGTMIPAFLGRHLRAPKGRPLPGGDAR